MKNLFKHFFRWELTHGKYEAKDELPPGKHSVKAVGKYEPDPNDIYMTEDGVKVCRSEKKLKLK